MIPAEPSADAREQAIEVLAGVRLADGQRFDPHSRPEAVRQVGLALDEGVPLDWITAYLRIGQHQAASASVGAVLRCCADMDRLAEGWRETQRA